jgi:hypothetical protein
MNKTHLTQIWQWLSVVCVLFLVTSIISIQGGSDFLGRLFGDKGASVADNKPAIGYFGAIIGGGILFVASSALALHARRHGERSYARIPVVWLEGLNTYAWEAKLFQVCILLMFVALPAAGTIRCMYEAEKGDICEQDTNNFYKGSDTTLLWAPVAKSGNQMRLRKAGAGNDACSAGIEIFPRSLTPLTFYGFPLAAGGMIAFAVAAIFRCKRDKSASSTGDEALSG